MRHPAPYILFASIVLVLLGLIIFKRREESAVYDDTNPNGLPSYCGARPRGMEGMLHHPRPGLVLHAVALTIRHGDRSAIHELPNTNETARWVCRLCKMPTPRPRHTHGAPTPHPRRTHGAHGRCAAPSASSSGGRRRRQGWSTSTGGRSTAHCCRRPTTARAGTARRASSPHAASRSTPPWAAT